jgi:tRNA pseudouridine55 synthase
VIPFLDEGVKCYEALMLLGVETDTLDMTGKLLAENNPSEVGEAQLQKVLEGFIGNISQIPPMYSAIKQDGQPLYKSARKGLEVERAPRPVEIYSIELISFSNPLAAFRVTCSRGTYIRTLADDIGRILGCGAALQELRRIASGPFSIANSLSLDQLEKAAQDNSCGALCTSPFDALAHLPDIPLTMAGLSKLMHGRSPLWSETLLSQPLDSSGPTNVRLSMDKRLCAVAHIARNDTGVTNIMLKRVFNGCLDKKDKIQLC